MVNIPLFAGFYTSQVVQDFVHQLYQLQQLRGLTRPRKTTQTFELPHLFCTRHADDGTNGFKHFVYVQAYLGEWSGWVIHLEWAWNHYLEKLRNCVDFLFNMGLIFLGKLYYSDLSRGSTQMVV